jgi:hypothetical protein
MEFTINLTQKGIINNNAKKAKALEIIGNNLDLEAIEILASKSRKPGISDKLKRFKTMI